MRQWIEGASRGQRRATEAALLFVLGPSLLAALALEHANDPPGLGIEHLHREGWPLATVVAGLSWIWLIAGKDFVLKVAVHGTALAERTH